jgi:hypothetical protein
LMAKNCFAHRIEANSCCKFVVLLNLLCLKLTQESTPGISCNRTDNNK